MWLRSRLLKLLPNTVGAMGTTPEEFILLQFPRDTREAECVWLIGNYVEVVDSTVMSKGKKLTVDHLRGVLRSRLQAMSSRAVLQPLYLDI